MYLAAIKIWREYGRRYKDDSISKRDKILDRFYLEDGRQPIKVLELIKKYCPNSAKFIK